MKYVFSALVFALAVAVFALQNAAPVTVSFAVWSFQTSSVIVILGAATLGALTILPLAFSIQFRLHWALHKTKQRNAELEAQLARIEEQQKQKDEQIKENITNES